MTWPRKVSAKGRAMIAREEGRRYQAYKDTQGHWTIGVGHLIGPDEQHLIGATLTDAQVDRLLDQDLKEAEQAVSSLDLVLWPGQFDALTSFAFNVGASGLRNSTLARRLKDGAPAQGVVDAWRMWRANPELIPRREREIVQFSSARDGAITAALVLGALVLILAAWKR